MNSRILFLSLLWFVCLDTTVAQDKKPYKPRVRHYSTNVSSTTEDFTLTVAIYQRNDTVFAERSQCKLSRAGEPYHVVFFETENVLLDEKGYLRQKHEDSKVWLIPFNFGNPPVRLTNGTRQVKYDCNCQGFPSPEFNSDVCIHYMDQQKLWCTNDGTHSCLITKMSKFCRGALGLFNTEHFAFYEFYPTGGVIVEGEVVMAMDPGYYLPPVEGKDFILFRQMEDGTWMQESDYQKMKEKKD